MKLNIWLDKWFNNYMKPSIKLKTQIKYEAIIRLHINPILGNYDIDSLSIDVLQGFFLDKIKKGNIKTNGPLAINTILSIYSILKMALNNAVSFNISNNTNINKVKIPKKDNKKIEVYDLTEQKKLISYCLNSNKANYIGIVICLYTGLRLGELLALEWEDIDFNNKILTISKTSFTITVDGKDIAYINSPKTKTSNRIIPIPEELLIILDKYYKLSSSKYVISTKKGNIIENRAYQKTFKSIQNKCNIKERNFHTLRHSFATRALENGMDVKTLSEILGHKSPMITLNCYSHSLLSYKIEMMNKVGNILK